MRERPQTGDIYRHFKNKLYQIVGIAAHSETGEELVIYQALYGDFRLYARPLIMFMSEVDKEKYPDVLEKYRFEKVSRELLLAKGDGVLQASHEVKETETVIETETLDDDNDEKVDERLMMFLEAETFADKMNVLTHLKNKMDDGLINAIAASLDAIVPEGDIDTRYNSLRNFVSTHAKFECNRFR